MEDNNKDNYLNPIAQHIMRQNNFKNKFINDIKKNYNKPDEISELQEYLRPIYLETLCSLYNIFNKNASGPSEIKTLLRHACTLKAYDNYIINSFFERILEKYDNIDNNEESSKRYQLLNEIIKEYEKRKQLYMYQGKKKGEKNLLKLKKALISDCMKYIIHRINKRLKYIYNLKCKLNNLNLIKDVKKRRGAERKLKFIQHLYRTIDKCCINLIHLTLKEALPVVHDVHVVIRNILSNDHTIDMSILKGTNDLKELNPENIQDDSLVFTWFLVMFSMFRIKKSIDADKDRQRLTESYLDAGNAKANEYGNKKTAMKFLQNRITKLRDNIDNFKRKYEWERLKKERKVYKVYKQKLLEEPEEYRTHFETGIMTTIPRILKARQLIRCLFKLLSGTEVDASDPKYLEKMQLEREEKEEDTDKKKKNKKKKLSEVEEVDIKETIRNVFSETNDKVYSLYASVDSMLANMMAETNRSVYLQRDVKVAMKNYVKETRKSAGLAPFKPAARKKMMYNIEHNTSLSQNLRTIMKKQVNCLHRMTRHQKRFRRTFKRFRKCNEAGDLNMFPPALEMVYKIWEKRSYRRRLRKGYRKKVKLFPKFDFMFVEVPRKIRLKTREKKLAQEFVQPARTSTKTHEKKIQYTDEYLRRKIYKPKRKGPGVWTSSMYQKIQKEFDDERHKRRDPLTDFKEKTPTECDLARMSKWNFIGDVYNSHKKFLPKKKPDVGHYMKALLDKNKRHQMKEYLERRKQLQKFCDKHDFKQDHLQECERQLPEAILTEDVETVKRRRDLKMIKDLMYQNQLVEEMNKEETSDEEFQQIKDIIKRKQQAEKWCDEHDNKIKY